MGVIDSATHRRDHAPVRLGFLSSTSKLSVLVWSIPCCIAVAYLCIFVARFSHNILLIGWIGDYGWGFLLPQSVVKTGIGDYTNIGTYGSYVPLWFGLLTARLPLHRELWQIAPTALYVSAALTVGWSVAQLATRRAAAIAVLIATVASPMAWGVFMAPVAHNVVYPCTALLGAYLVWLTRGDGRRRVTVLAVPLLLAVVLGACLASDSLLVATAILPISLIGVLACLRRNRRSRIVGLSALTTVVLALPIALLTSSAMSSLGYKTEVQSLEVAPLSFLSAHFHLLVEGLKRLFNGYLGVAAPGALHTELGYACDIVLLLAFAAMLIAAGRSAIHFLLSFVRADDSTQPPQLVLDLHVTYWVASAISACGVFVLSTFLDSAHESFYATVILSVAAVVPLFVHSRSPMRWLIPVGMSVFFVASLVGMASYDVVPINTPLIDYEPQILKLAQSNHVTVGYSGYWGASSLTWNSRERVKVRPVYRCPGSGGAVLCRFPHGTVGSWYVPTQRRSFLIVEPNVLTTTAISVLPSTLGRPLTGYTIGPVQMYIYPYDIASRVQPVPRFP